VYSLDLFVYSLDGPVLMKPKLSISSYFDPDRGP